MGVDLKLLPIESEHDDWGYSHSAIACSRDYDLHDKLRALPDAGPPPADFATFVGGRIPDGTFKGQTCYGKTTTDPYGAPLRCVFAGDVGKLKTDMPRNKAAIAYCRALDPKTRIALWWH